MQSIIAKQGSVILKSDKPISVETEIINNLFVIMVFKGFNGNENNEEPDYLYFYNIETGEEKGGNTLIFNSIDHKPVHIEDIISINREYEYQNGTPEDREKIETEISNLLEEEFGIKNIRFEDLNQTRVCKATLETKNGERRLFLHSYNKPKILAKTKTKKKGRELKV